LKWADSTLDEQHRHEGSGEIGGRREADKDISVHGNEVVSADLPGREFVDITPNPGFSGFNRAHERVLGMMKMLGGVLVFRRITAADIAALQTQPQMNPGVAHLYAFFARVVAGAGELDLIEV
jgi:hypothetical protein